MIVLLLALLVAVIVATVIVKLARRRGRAVPRRVALRDREGLSRIKVGLRQRSYVYRVPPGVGVVARPPVVMAFHGGFGNPLSFAQRSDLDDAAARHGFAVAYLAADGHWADGRESTGLGLDDIEFALRLRDQLVREQGADAARIYALGASNGGMFTLRLAIEAPDEFAAFAAALASIPVPLLAAAPAGSPAPLMLINALHDPAIPWRGGRVGWGLGGTVIGVEETVDFWRLRNRCGTPTVTEFYGGLSDHEVVAELQSYPCSAGGADLEFMTLFRAEHRWPNVSLSRSPATDGSEPKLKFNDLVWAFLSRHVRPTGDGRIVRPQPSHSSMQGLEGFAHGR